MTRNFVLDENVLKAAVSCSATANKLVERILANRHCLVTNNWLYHRYWNILATGKDSIHLPFLQPLLGNILHDATRCCFLTEVFDDKERIPVRHRKDVFLAQIAKAANLDVIVVLSDKKTREDLNRLGIRAATLKEAVELASQS